MGAKGVANVPTKSYFRVPESSARVSPSRSACCSRRVSHRQAASSPITYTPGAAGAGDPYFPLDGNGGYDAEHYLLDLQYDPTTDVIGGSATILARATQDLSRFNLDLEGLAVHSVEVDDRNAKWSRDGGELVITPNKGIRERQRFTTKIVYSGVPEPIVDAFGVSGFIHTDDGAMIIGEPHVADTWYPVNDHPSDKAAYTFRIKVPAWAMRRSPTASSRTSARAEGGRRGRGMPASRWRPT